MNPRTAEDLQDLLAADVGFYLRADRLVRLLTLDNVDEIMAVLPAAFRDEFIAFARDAYAGDGEWLAIAGPPVPITGLEAVRSWLAATERRSTKPPRLEGWLGVDIPLHALIEASGPRGSAGRNDEPPMALRIELAESAS